MIRIAFGVLAARFQSSPARVWAVAAERLAPLTVWETRYVLGLWLQPSPSTWPWRSWGTNHQIEVYVCVCVFCVSGHSAYEISNSNKKCTLNTCIWSIIYIWGQNCPMNAVCFEVIWGVEFVKWVNLKIQFSHDFVLFIVNMIFGHLLLNWYFKPNRKLMCIFLIWLYCFI